MSEITPTDPLLILEDYERRARDSAKRIPETEDTRSLWMGVGFQVADTPLALASGEVQELLNYPHVYPVPGTRSWVKGLANVRGRILTVVDLGGFLLNRPTALMARSRVLAVRDDTMQAGFLVDGVTGMRHFPENEFNVDVAGFPDWISPFLTGRFSSQDESWGVMNLTAVLNSPDFIQVGL